MSIYFCILLGLSVMETSGDFPVTNNSSVETDGTQILETPPSHNTIREGMS